MEGLQNAAWPCALARAVFQFIKRSLPGSHPQLAGLVVTPDVWRAHAAELWPVHCSTPRYAAHGPTASRYWWAITLESWCKCVRSCAAQAASNCPKLTVPKAGCLPCSAWSLGCRFKARSSARFSCRRRANSSSNCPSCLPSLSFTYPRRSKGSNVLLLPDCSTIFARGIQSARSV
jgi:hypothetical protein